MEEANRHSWFLHLPFNPTTSRFPPRLPRASSHCRVKCQRDGAKVKLFFPPGVSLSELRRSYKLSLTNPGNPCVIDVLTPIGMHASHPASTVASVLLFFFFLLFLGGGEGGGQDQVGTQSSFRVLAAFEKLEENSVVLTSSCN